MHASPLSAFRLPRALLLLQMLLVIFAGSSPRVSCYRPSLFSAILPSFANLNERQRILLLASSIPHRRGPRFGHVNLSSKPHPRSRTTVPSLHAALQSIYLLLTVRNYFDLSVCSSPTTGTSHTLRQVFQNRHTPASSIPH